MRYRKEATMKYIIFLCTCAFILHTFLDHTYAGTLVLWDTRSLPTVSSNSHPAIHGRSLVWQAKGGIAGTTSSKNDWEIYHYDLELKTVTQLTDDSLDDTLPKTDGAYIVWQKFEVVAGNQIFLYQVNGSNPPGGTQVSITANGDQFSPDIAEGIIIWSRQYIDQSFSPREILLYNAQTHTGPTVISNPAYNCDSPRIASNQIIYLQNNPDGTETLFLYDKNELLPVAKPAPDDLIWYANSQVDGKQTVLSRYNGADREIYLHTPTEGYKQITDNDINDTNPTINQNHIAWVADKEIYLTDIRMSQPPLPENKCTHFTIPTKSGTTISICL